MSYEENSIKIGVAVLCLKSNLILIGYDGEKKKYSFPGGHWEEKNNESLEEATTRELFEETGGLSNIPEHGVKCDNFKKLYDYKFFREDNKQWYRSIGFTADYLTGIAGDDPSEQRFNWKFMKPEEIIKLDLFEPARKGLEILLEKTRKTRHF